MALPELRPEAPTGADITITPPAVIDTPCTLCGGPLFGSTMTTNLKPLCHDCGGKLRRELAAQEGAPSDVPMALLAGGAGAVVAAVAWAAIEVATGFRIGFVSVGVGWLVGWAVAQSVGASRNVTLQVVAAAWSIGGLVLARYAVFAHAVKQELDSVGTPVGYFNPVIVAEFQVALPQLLSFFDVLWVALAVSTAWRALAPANVSVED